MKAVPFLLLAAGCVVAPDRALDEVKLRARALMAQGDDDSLRAAAGQWVLVLAGNSDQPSRREAALGLSRILGMKLARPIADVDPRRFLLEARAELERYALDRTPKADRNADALSAALNELAAELTAQAAGANRRVAAAWNARAADLAFEAGQARVSPERFSAALDTVEFVESDASRHLEVAGLAAEAANLEICKTEPSAVAVVAAIEQGLRRWIYVIETTGDSRALEAARFWERRLADWSR